MKRLIIVYNPRSTRFFEVQKKILEPARKLKGWTVGKFEVRKAGVKENAKELAGIIRKGDLVLSAGGDGTASMVLNAVLESGKLATMAVAGFGNFNDYAKMFGEMSLKQIVRRFEEGRSEEFFPLEVRVNEKHARYIGTYFTIGLMAKSVRIFEREKVRRGLTRARNRLQFSLERLARWYFVNKRRKDFLPEGMKVNGVDVLKNTTDYVALNGEELAGLVETKGWEREEKKFLRLKMRNRSFFRLVREFLRMMEGEEFGEETEGDRLEFFRPAEVWANFEGEGEKLSGVREIEVRKTGEKVRVVRAV